MHSDLKTLLLIAGSMAISSSVYASTPLQT